MYRGFWIQNASLAVPSMAERSPHSADPPSVELSLHSCQAAIVSPIYLAPRLTKCTVLRHIELVMGEGGGVVNEREQSIDTKGFYV